MKDRVLARCVFVSVKALRGLISGYFGLHSPKSSIQHGAPDMKQLGGLATAWKGFSGHSIHGIPKLTSQVAGRNSPQKTTTILENCIFIFLTVGSVVGGRKCKAHSSLKAGLRAVVDNMVSYWGANGWDPGFWCILLLFFFLFIRKRCLKWGGQPAFHCSLYVCLLVSLPLNPSQNQELKTHISPKPLSRCLSGTSKPKSPVLCKTIWPRPRL